MAERMPQTYENHVRFVPAYHLGAFGILVINLIWTIYKLIRDFSGDSAIAFLVAVALLLIFFHARIFPLKAQDRIIRLEMQLRMERILPPDLKARIPEFTVSQIVALRFASDEELPELARKVLANNIQKRDEIKKMIRKWNPDYLRV